MMIEIYTGFVGSGKSFHVTKRATTIADAPAGKRYVVANFPIKPKKKFLAKIPFIKNRLADQYNKPRWLFKDNSDMTVDYLIKLSDEMGWYGKESQCLLIIDEAGIVFNSRDWNVKPAERKDWIKFFTQSRKLGYDIVLVVQDSRMLDRQIRSLCEFEVQHKKVNSWFIFKYVPVTIFAAVSFWNGIKSMRGSLELCLYSKAVADRYDTLKLFGYAGKE